MEIKSELKYTKDHEWIEIDGKIATVGITDYAQGELGDIVYVEIETLDERLDKEEVFGSCRNPCFTRRKTNGQGQQDYW